MQGEEQYRKWCGGVTLDLSHCRFGKRVRASNGVITNLQICAEAFFVLSGSRGRQLRKMRDNGCTHLSTVGRHLFLACTETKAWQTAGNTAIVLFF